MKKYWDQFIEPLEFKNSWPAIVWFLLILIIMASLFFIPRYLDIFSVDSHNRHIVEYQSFYFLLSLAFTTLVSAVALLQLRSLKRNSRANFLLHIDERWGNKENIKARTIIHSMYLEAETKHNQSTNQNLTLIFDDVAHQILALRESFNKKDPEKFIILLSYLDFMETIGYLAKSKYVSLNDLNELCGYTLQFNYEIFKLYIEDKRNRHNKNDFYYSFTELYNALKAQS